MKQLTLFVIFVIIAVILTACGDSTLSTPSPASECVIVPPVTLNPDLSVTVAIRCRSVWTEKTFFKGQIRPCDGGKCPRTEGNLLYIPPDPKWGYDGRIY